jgi:hypothetical protein
MQSGGRFAPSTVLRSARTPNGSVPVGIPALHALRVAGRRITNAGTPAARNSDLVNSETGRPARGCCRCQVCRSPTEFLSESVAASNPETRQANYCNCRKLCGRLIRIHDRARSEFVHGIELHRIERGDLVLIIIAIKRATALPYSIANRVEHRVADGRSRHRHVCARLVL